MKHHFTDSTSIEYCSYDDKENVLTIKFVNGKQYSYSDVPKDKFDELKQAKSAGKYFQTKIRNNHKLI
jgi:hypothetical protein